MKITENFKQWLLDHEHIGPNAGERTIKHTIGRLLASDELSAELYQELSTGDDMTTTSPDPTKVFSGPRLVKVPGSYSEDRIVCQHTKTGQPVKDTIYGGEATLMSEGAAERHGVFLKHLARKAGILQTPATNHEQTLLNDLATAKAWAGQIGGEDYAYIGPNLGQKALLDDASSGGISITPIEFDADVLTFPLLSGELYPFCDIKEVPRGRRIESGSIGTPTISWGETDGSETALFNTADLVGALNCTIFSVRVAVEVGNDFLSDSPVNVGQTLTQLIGERLAAELDRIVAVGNGSTEPTGIFTSSGVTEVNSDNGGSGPPTLNDYLSMFFALPKQYRTPGMRPSFVSNDTSYARSRSIKVDPSTPTTDQRPVMAPLTEVSSYMTLGVPHRIQNDIGNRSAGIVSLSKYRMYRRQGLEIMWTREGQYLARRNLSLLVATARFGGFLRDTNAMIKWTDAQS